MTSSVFTLGARVRMVSARDEVPAGTLGTVVGFSGSWAVPWPVHVEFDGCPGPCLCAESELEPLS